MRIRLVIRILGFLTMFLGVAMLLPVPFSIYYGDGDIIPILLSAGITAAFGSIFFFLSGTKEEMRPKEGFAVVTFGWIVLSIFGSLPFILSGSIPNYADAFFETISGFTTTGATILEDIEVLPHGILFWRSLTHWIGGMGIIVMSIAILPFLGVGGMQLFKAEVPGPAAEKLTPRITETAKILWYVYLLISITETVLLMIGGMNLFEALCHTFGTMATGGFSTKNASIGHFNSGYIDFVIIFFMFVAGTNFSLHYRLLKGNIGEYWKSNEFRFYVGLILTATVILGIDTYLNNYSTIFETVRYTLFQVMAILTTTGYGTADYEKWSLSSQLILFTLMFVGGCAGSTGGGMKVLRIFVLVKFAYSEIVKLIHPRAVIPIKIGNVQIDRNVVMNIAGFFVIYVLIAVLGTLIMALIGYDLPTSLGMVAAAINNIGPGLGAVGPTDNYAFLPDAVKLLLTLFMLIGRLEVFTVIILLAPSFWKK